jgi:A/G-specific adenine glycosylase
MTAAHQGRPDRSTPLYSPGEDEHGIGEFREMVLAGYRRSGRKLAWRSTTDPYRILVSEIMLQQTQVERVEQKYPPFLQAFPDFPALASAPLPEVLAAWQGMGYNRRAIALQQCAQRVVGEHGGNLPADPGILATFPGIGRATASSICAFAFAMPVVFIETNIRRVFIHFFFSDADTVADAAILPLAERALYREDPREWYNALMDLGTALKKSVPNPNRRSAHYTKQSVFHGSDREIRGTILKILLAGTTVTEEMLIRRICGDPERIRGLIAALERERFIVRNHSQVHLAGYVPGEHDTGSSGYSGKSGDESS